MAVHAIGYSKKMRDARVYPGPVQLRIRTAGRDRAVSISRYIEASDRDRAFDRDRACMYTLPFRRPHAPWRDPVF